jgi:tetratricopeptide (TPR) repeat protein
MNRKLSFSEDDESNDTIKRYEQFLSGTANGYFDVEELENIVEYYLINGRTKDCTKVIDFGLKLHPNNNALKAKRGKIYLITGDVKKAFRVLNSLPESNDYEVILLKTEVFLKLGRFDEAKILSDKLLEEESDELDNVCLDFAYIFLAEREFDTGLKLLEKGYSFNNKNTELLYELAFCYEQNDDFEKAESINLQIVDIDPFANEAWYNLGQLYFAEMKFTEALDAYEYALAIDETDSFSCLQKGHVHFQLNQFEEAIETYQMYKKMSLYGKWDTDIFIAECFEKLEKYEESILYYKQSLEAHPENFEALTGIAICLLEQEKFIESLSYSKQALVLNPEAADAWVYMAEAYIGLDDIDKALLSYLKSITIDHEQPDTLMAIANICLEKAEFELAIKYYLEAQKLDEFIEYTDLFIAVCYFKLGDIQKTTIYLNIALKKDNDAADLFLELCPEAEDLNLLS